MSSWALHAAVWIMGLVALGMLFTVLGAAFGGGS